MDLKRVNHTCSTYTTNLIPNKMNKEYKIKIIPIHPDLTLPNHLHPDAQYLICSDCERKSYNAQINSSCNMIQPDGSICKGVFKIPK